MFESVRICDELEKRARLFDQYFPPPHWNDGCGHGLAPTKSVAFHRAGARVQYCPRCRRNSDFMPFSQYRKCLDCDNVQRGGLLPRDETAMRISDGRQKAKRPKVVAEPDVDLSGILGVICFCCHQPATTTTQDGKYNVCAEHAWFIFWSYSSYRGEHE